MSPSLRYVVEGFFCTIWSSLEPYIIDLSRFYKKIQTFPYTVQTRQAQRTQVPLPPDRPPAAAVGGVPWGPLLYPEGAHGAPYFTQPGTQGPLLYPGGAHGAPFYGWLPYEEKIHARLRAWILSEWVGCFFSNILLYDFIYSNMI